MPPVKCIILLLLEGCNEPTDAPKLDQGLEKPQSRANIALSWKNQQLLLKLSPTYNKPLQSNGLRGQENEEVSAWLKPGSTTSNTQGQSQPPNQLPNQGNEPWRQIPQVRDHFPHDRLTDFQKDSNDPNFLDTA